MNFASLYLERLHCMFTVLQIYKRKALSLPFLTLRTINGFKIILTLKIDDTIVRRGHRQIRNITMNMCMLYNCKCPP